jgi:Domain of unknown function (DUF4436)
VSDESAEPPAPAPAEPGEPALPGSPQASAPRQRPRQPWVLISVGAVIVVLYVLSIVLYASSGGIHTATPDSTTPDPGGVTIRLTPQSVLASSQRVTMDLSIDTSPQLTDSNTISPSETINVVVSPTGGSQTTTFMKHEIPATVALSIISTGEIENWPFDTYRTENLTVVACKDDCATHPVLLPAKVYMEGDVPGWTFTASVKKSGEQIDFRASRSGSTVVFGVLLLALMIAMPCLVLFVGISTLAGRRKVEPSFMSWMAAMLFATVPLRTFLPGSPPIGSWIDFLVVLWVIVALVVGLIIYVVAWARQKS